MFKSKLAEATATIRLLESKLVDADIASKLDEGTIEGLRLKLEEALKEIQRLSLPKVSN